MPAANPYTIDDIERLFYSDLEGRVRSKPGNGRREPHKVVDNRMCYKGYRRVRFRVGGKDCTVGAHRIVFALTHGYLPPQVDHIDTNKQNNKIDNLRAADNQKNQWNVSRKRKLIHKGVHYLKSAGRYQVRVATKRGRKFIGYFDDLELANLIADESIRKYHGEFANAE